MLERADALSPEDFRRRSLHVKQVLHYVWIRLDVKRIVLNAVRLYDMHLLGSTLPSSSKLVMICKEQSQMKLDFGLIRLSGLQLTPPCRYGLRKNHQELRGAVDHHVQHNTTMLSLERAACGATLYINSCFHALQTSCTAARALPTSYRGPAESIIVSA